MVIKIGTKSVGGGKPCFVVAEMSGNHGGDLNRAIKIVRAAKRAGADAIKLQTYTADTITFKSKKKDFLIPKSSPWFKYKTLWNLYNKAHTPWKWHKRIFEEAKSLKLEIFSTPFDESAVDFLEKLNCPAYKIASSEINHIPLIKKVAKTKKPVILSTGLSDFTDLTLAVRALRNNGCKKIIILKCVSTYPAPIDEQNLKTIVDIKKKFNVVSGLSDHTIDSLAATTSVALGASVIEKHFNLLDKNSTVDSFFSANEISFKKMVEKIRLVEKSLGEIKYDFSKSSKANLNGRRSIYVVKKIYKGELITSKNTKVIRPGFGLRPILYGKVDGLKAKINLNPGDRLTRKAVGRK